MLKPKLTADTRIRLSQIIDLKKQSITEKLLKDTKYSPGKRTQHSDGTIWEKQNSGKWKKIANSIQEAQNYKYDEFTRKNDNFDRKGELLMMSKPQIQKMRDDLNSRTVSQGRSLKNIPNDKKLKEQFAKEWVKQNVHEPIKTEIGDVEFTEKSVETSLQHGNSEEKIAALPVVKDVLEKGVYLGRAADYTENDNNINRVNYFIAGRVNIDGKNKIIFLRIRHPRGSNKRLYIHDIFTDADIKKDDSTKRKTATNVAGFLTNRRLFSNILANFLQ